MNSSILIHIWTAQSKLFTKKEIGLSLGWERQGRSWRREMGDRYEYVIEYMHESLKNKEKKHEISEPSKTMFV